jgi:hypothetical protein
VRSKKELAVAGQNNELALMGSRFAIDRRDLKIHECVVAKIDEQIGISGDRKSKLFALKANGDSFLTQRRSRGNKIGDRIANLGSIVGIRDEKLRQNCGNEKYSARERLLGFREYRSGAANQNLP